MLDYIILGRVFSLLHGIWAVGTWDVDSWYTCKAAWIYVFLIPGPRGYHMPYRRIIRVVVSHSPFSNLSMISKSVPKWQRIGEDRTQNTIATTMEVHMESISDKFCWPQWRFPSFYRKSLYKGYITGIQDGVAPRSKNSYSLWKSHNLLSFGRVI